MKSIQPESQSVNENPEKNSRPETPSPFASVACLPLHQVDSKPTCVSSHPKGTARSAENAPKARRDTIQIDFSTVDDVLTWQEEVELHHSILPVGLVPNSEFEIAGTGVPGEICGTWKSAACVRRHLSPIRMTCKQFCCPECWKYAAYEGGDEAEKRLSAAQREFKIQHYPRHFMFSPSPESYPEPAMIGIRTLRTELMRWIDLFAAPDYGGMLVFHPYRLTKAAYLRYVATGIRDEKIDWQVEDERKWEWWREQVDRDNLIVWAPHFHFVGFLFIEPTSAEFYRQTSGWVYKNIRPLKDSRAVWSCAQYVLNHKAVITELAKINATAVRDRIKADAKRDAKAARQRARGAATAKATADGLSEKEANKAADAASKLAQEASDRALRRDLRAAPANMQTTTWIGCCSRVRLGYVVTDTLYEPVYCRECKENGLEEPLYSISTDSETECLEGMPVAVNPPPEVITDADYVRWLEGHRPVVRVIELRKWFARHPKKKKKRAEKPKRKPEVQGALFARGSPG